MSIMLLENERGFLFKYGKFVKLLQPGKYPIWRKGYQIETLKICDPVQVKDFPIELLLQHKEVAEELSVIDVADGYMAIHFINGRFADCLTRGTHAFWKVHGAHTYEIINLTIPEVSDSFPQYLFEYIRKSLYTKIEVLSYQKARLYFNQKFQRLLDEGTYYFWNCGTKVTAEYVDTRLLQMNIAGQEIMSADKVGLRINVVCQYKITDYIKIHTEIQDIEEQIHILVQLALREYIGRYRLDELLENKENISNYIYQQLKEKEEQYFVKFFSAGVKDIILPGDIRSIMNTVLIAEKKAQANVIARREEVASTRSLLNTAKLMEENKTLYKLKELEYLERICDNIGNITVNGGTDIMGQLSAILKGS